ncbi:MAG: tRNA1(Val) (adenine(37)-N6)-methyltransferase [Deltaproteobacteria bacterium]|nr:tRNA1(Val) (adenine(37)-N6)-methyltransferase [Deltaproteobacteria bacterium]
MKKQPGPSKNETLDALFQGRLTIIQKKGGYRFSLDAVLLAHFVEVDGREKIIDLGTGSGVIPLVLASLYPSVRVIGLELQEEMVQRALRSVVCNGLEDRVGIVQGDVCSIQQDFSPQGFDAAVCNPPYRGLRNGRINADPERRVARHEIKGYLRDFLRAGFYLLRRKGKMALIYPAARTLDLLQTMRQESLEPKRLRLVHSFEGATATLVLAEGIKDGRSELKIMPPLVIYTQGRKYTEEMRAVLGK